MVKEYLPALLVVLIILAVGFVSAAEYHGSFDVDTGSGSVIINPDQCQEDWSGSGWGECIEGNQTFICFDKNQCGTTVLQPSQCGDVQACDTEEDNGGDTGGSPGGGGSSSSSSSGGPVNLNVDVTGDSEEEECTENWACYSWSNTDDSCGTRECVDLNDCGTEELIPDTVRECPEENGFSITGGAIGAQFNKLLESRAGLPILIILVIVIAGLIISYKGKKKSPKE